MIRAWRLVQKIHADDAFSGDGARLKGGRWNHKGVSVVYVSENLALSVLEAFVNLPGGKSSVPYVYIPIEIPESVSIEELKPAGLLNNWRELPPPASTKDLGTNWAKSMRTAILRVPSIIIPIEANFVLNTSHPDFKKIKIGNPQVFSFDPRMWK